MALTLVVGRSLSKGKLRFPLMDSPFHQKSRFDATAFKKMINSGINDVIY